MERIVLFTDSLALPRKVPEMTSIEDTYPYLLKKNFDVYQFSKGGCLISELLEQTFYYSQYRPDYVILQCGIVDCAPRAFSWSEESFLRLTRIGRLLRKAISITITTKRIRNFRRKSWTELKSFECLCNAFVNQFDGIPVYALSILPATSEYELQVPGISKKIKEYNIVLSRVFGDRLIDLSGIPVEGIMSDHHHLTQEGHIYVYESIMDKLKKAY